MQIMEGRDAISIIKFILLYSTSWQGLLFGVFFLSDGGGGCFSVSGVVLRSDALARSSMVTLPHPHPPAIPPPH